MSAWQPIETAPKDGTRILAYGLERKRYWIVDVVRWHQPGNPVHDGFWIGTHYTIKPTHWMPLPEPPA